jgi:RNA polymerase sigma factor FliA
LYYLEDLNLKEIGKIMDLTDSRISQLRTGAILRLRARLAEIALKNKVRARDMFGS